MPSARRAIPTIAVVLALLAPARAEASQHLSEEIAATVSRHADKIRRCYRQGLRSDPALRGKLVVRFRIGPSGRASPIAVDGGRSTMRHARVERCVKRVFRAIRFRRLDDPEWFHSPLIFA